LNIIAIVNQKGGVGKTTTGVNLAGIYAYWGFSSLIVDADPQRNMTSYFIDPMVPLPDEDTIAAIYKEKINDDHPRRIIRPTRMSNLDLVPGGFSLSANVWQLFQDKQAGLKLDQFLQLVRKQKKYDFVFVDCPPEIGFFTLGAFFASDWIIIPTQAERLSVEGITELMKQVQNFWKLRGGQKPQILGTLVTLFSEQNRSHKEWERQITAATGPLKFEEKIHTSSAISRASDAKRLLIEDANLRKGRSGQEYIKVAKEVLKRLQKNHAISEETRTKISKIQGTSAEVLKILELEA
jgi:chromosome partitioning protein